MSCSVPVEDSRASSRVVRGYRHVVEPPVIVKQGDFGRPGKFGKQPGGELVGPFVVFVLGPLPPCCPALDLTPEKSCGVTEIAEIALFGTGRMELGESVDNHFRQRPIGRLVGATPKSGGYLPANHHTGSSFHEEERTSDHGDVITVGHGSRRPVKNTPQPGKDAVLATHVMGLGGHRPQWWSSQYQFGAVGEDKEVGQICLAAAKLAHLGLAAG